MLSHYMITLQKQKDCYLGQHIATAFHEYLYHKAELEQNMVSQWVHIEETSIIWHISIIGEHTIQTVIQQQTISIQSYTFPVQSVSVSQRSFQSYMDDIFSESKTYRRYVRLQFVSPCAFKTNKTYQNYPTIHHILHSIAKKMEQCNLGVRVYDNEVLSELEQMIVVTQYHLQSRTFLFQGHKIPSYSGELTLCITGALQMVRFAIFLLTFGMYCGVGVKTVWGMGGIIVKSDIISQKS